MKKPQRLRGGVWWFATVVSDYRKRTTPWRRTTRRAVSLACMMYEKANMKGG